MERLLGLLVAVSLLAGCQNSAPTAGRVDPFFGRTRVEPPRTGCVSGWPNTDPYYSGTKQAQAAQSSAIASQVPAVSGSADSPRYQPADGSFNYQGGSIASSGAVASIGSGDRIVIPPAARTLSPFPSAGVANRPRPSTRTTNQPANSATAASSAVAVAETPVGSAPRVADRRTRTALADRERIVRVLEPRPAVSPASRVPGRLSPSGRVIDIMDLPAAGAASSRESSSRDTSNGIRLVTAVEEAAGLSNGSASRVRRADSFSARARYGRAADYQWLRGQLEYSQIDRCWKLRYIPIDGDTDAFGGSVVLRGAALLSGYERGDWVEVRGQLGSAAAGDSNFAPEYHVTEIKRLGD